MASILGGELKKYKVMMKFDSMDRIWELLVDAGANNVGVYWSDDSFYNTFFAAYEANDNFEVELHPSDAKELVVRGLLEAV